MFELLTGQLPFGRNGAEGMDFVPEWIEERGQFNPPIEGRKFKKMRTDLLPWLLEWEVSTKAQKLLFQFWTQYNKRPTVEEAMEHVWFHGDFYYPSMYLPGGPQ